jgi:hypothetical protein
VAKVGTVRTTQGEHNKPGGCCASGAYALGPDYEEEEEESCRENQNKHFKFCNFSENRAVYELMWKNMVQPVRSHITQYGACALHAGQLRQE